MSTSNSPPELNKPRADSPRSFPDAAEFLRVSVRHLQRLADAGRVRTIRLGRRRLLPADEVERLARDGC